MHATVLAGTNERSNFSFTRLDGLSKDLLPAWIRQCSAIWGKLESISLLRTCSFDALSPAAQACQRMATPGQLESLRSLPIGVAKKGRKEKITDLKPPDVQQQQQTMRQWRRRQRRRRRRRRRRRQKRLTAARTDGRRDGRTGGRLADGRTDGRRDGWPRWPLLVLNPSVRPSVRSHGPIATGFKINVEATNTILATHIMDRLSEIQYAGHAGSRPDPFTTVEGHSCVHRTELENTRHVGVGWCNAYHTFFAVRPSYLPICTLLPSLSCLVASAAGRPAR